MADLAIANLNEVEAPADEAFTLGRVIRVSNAINHEYKSLLQRGAKRAEELESLRSGNARGVCHYLSLWEQTVRDEW